MKIRNQRFTSGNSGIQQFRDKKYFLKVYLSLLYIMDIFNDLQDLSVIYLPSSFGTSAFIGL